MQSQQRVIECLFLTSDIETKVIFIIFNSISLNLIDLLNAESTENNITGIGLENIWQWMLIIWNFYFANAFWL